MADPLPRDLRFDLLRGGAILYIVGYYHIQDVWQVNLPGPVAGWLARLALALFCFLSGTLLSRNTLIDGWKSAGRFYKKRLLKIYPLYLLALAGFATLGLCPKGLFLPSALLVNTLLNWNLLTLWFVSMIFLFYLVTPLFLHRPSVQRTWILTLLFTGTLLAVKSCSTGIDPRIFPNFIAFAFGILLNQSSVLRGAFLAPQILSRLFSMAALVFLSGFAIIPPNDAAWLHAVYVILLFLAALPWLMVVAHAFTRFLPARLIEYLAGASFVLYLIHRIVYQVGGSIFQSPSPIIQQFYYLLVLLPAALIASHYIQRAYQRLIK